MKKILITLFLITSLSSFAQMVPQWKNYYGFGDSLGIFPKRIVMDDSSNIYVLQEAARLRTFEVSPPRNPFVQKINKYGETVWIKNLGLDINSKEWPLSIKFGKDKNLYVLCSQFDSSTWTTNLFKLSTNGDSLWKKRLGFYNYQYNQEIQINSNGTIYSNARNELGYSCLCKFNSAGDILDSIFIVINNIPATIERYSITADNKIFIYSKKTESEIASCFVSLVDSTHNILWTREIIFSEVPYTLQTALDSSLYICFYKEEAPYEIVLTVYKYDYNGNLKWLKKLQGPAYLNRDYLYFGYTPKILFDNNCNPILASTTKISQSVSANSFGVTKLNKNSGEILWNCHQSDYMSNHGGILRGAITDSLGNIYISGETWYGTNYDFAIIKISTTGQVLRITANNGYLNFKFYPYFLEIAKNNDLIVTGIDYSLSSWDKGATIRYSQPINVTPNGNSLPHKFSLSQNYPNPFNPTTSINFQIPKSNFVALKIFDINGRLVSELVNENLIAGEYKINFDGSTLPSGVYYYKLTTNNFSETRKMVLLK